MTNDHGHSLASDPSTGRHLRLVDGASPSGSEKPGLDAVSTALTMCRAANRLRHELDIRVLHNAHLNWTNWDVLHLIVSRPGILTREVAAVAAISKSAVTQICNDLVHRGLVHREREGVGDSRLVRLYPTARAAHLVEQLLPQVNTICEAFIADNPLVGGGG